MDTETITKERQAMAIAKELKKVLHEDAGKLIIELYNLGYDVEIRQVVPFPFIVSGPGNMTVPFHITISRILKIS